MGPRFSFRAPQFFGCFFPGPLLFPSSFFGPPDFVGPPGFLGLPLFCAGKATMFHLGFSRVTMGHSKFVGTPVLTMGNNFEFSGEFSGATRWSRLDQEALKRTSTRISGDWGDTWGLINIPFKAPF